MPADISVNSSTGALTFNSAPDYETKTSYSITATASDGTNSTNQAISVTIANLNDNSPVISSSNSFNVYEGQQTIGTIRATDADGNSITYSISGTDASSISVNSSTGALTFNSAPDYETKTSYSIAATASDGTNSTNQAITVNILDVSEAPTFTSASSFTVNENQTSIGTLPSYRSTE